MKMLLIRNISLLFVLTVFTFDVFAGGINNNDMKKNWGNAQMSYCQASNPGNAVIGNKKDVCTGNNNSACLLGDDYGMLMLIARDVNANGAKFCVTTVYGERKEKGTAWTIYAEPAQGTKCFWLCKSGYSGDGCSSTTPNGCDTTPLQRSDFDQYSISRDIGVEGGIYMFHWDENQDCGLNSNHEHDMVLAISNWLPSGHGAKARSFVISSRRGEWKKPIAWPQVWGVGEETLLCKNGYRANAAGTDCEEIDANECARTQMCSGWNGGAFDAGTMVMEYNSSCTNDAGTKGGYIYKCKGVGQAFASATDRTCVACNANLRGGPSPDDGTCIKCDLGKIYDENVSSSGYCKATVALSKTDLQYGLGKTKDSVKDIKKQCWTIINPDEYKKCVTGSSLDSNTRSILNSIMEKSGFGTPKQIITDVPPVSEMLKTVNSSGGASQFQTVNLGTGTTSGSTPKVTNGANIGNLNQTTTSTLITAPQMFQM